jgi:hypothetical protein
MTKIPSHLLCRIPAARQRTQPMAPKIGRDVRKPQRHICSPPMHEYELGCFGLVACGLQRHIVQRHAWKRHHMHLYSIYPSICNWRMTVAFSVSTIPRDPPESKFTCNIGGPRRIGWCDRYSGVTPLQRRRPLGRQVWAGQGCGEVVEKSGTHIDHVATCNFPLSDNSRPACDECTIGMVGTDHGRALCHNGTSIRDRDDGDSGIQPLEYHAFREALIADLAGCPSSVDLRQSVRVTSN